MEKMPVATKDTIRIKPNKTYQLSEARSVNGKSVPFWMKNDIKTTIIMKKIPLKHIKKLILNTGH